MQPTTHFDRSCHFDGPLGSALASLILGISLAITTPCAGQDSDTPAPATSQTNESKEYFGEPITLSLKDADLVETLRSFAELGGFNLVIDPAVSGTVTAEFKDVPWDQALEAILKIHGLGMDISGGRRTIAPPQVIAEQRRRLETLHTVELVPQHLEPATLVDLLGDPASCGGKILTDRGAVRLGKDGETVVLRDLGKRLILIGKFLTALDSPQDAPRDPETLREHCRTLWSQTLDSNKG